MRDLGLHYLFAVKSTQPSFHTEAVRWMGGLEPDQAAATNTDLDHSRSVVRRIYLGEALAAPEGWEHLRTVLRVEVETLDSMAPSPRTIIRGSNRTREPRSS
ncbi:MAG: hypothetical protein AMXMBFR56_82340 [Polyangiaceae bacterium]